MSGLRALCISASKRRKVKVKQTHLDDLELMLFFLQTVHKGINLNLITHRRPTHIYFQDACPVGLGGYNHLGKCWRWRIPTHLQNRATINMLEHVASTIGPWIDIINDEIPPLSCILSMTDNTTSAGWLRKSNFWDIDDTKIHMQQKAQTARNHAKRMMQHRIKEYNQWFPGKNNIIADALSRDFHFTDTKLISIFNSLFSSQMHLSFEIVQLPQKIDC